LLRVGDKVLNLAQENQYSNYESYVDAMQDRDNYMALLKDGILLDDKNSIINFLSRRIKRAACL